MASASDLGEDSSDISRLVLADTLKDIVSDGSIVTKTTTGLSPSTRDLCMAVKLTLLSDIAREAVCISTAAELALVLSLRAEALREAVASLVALSADISALDIVSLLSRESSLDDLVEDVVDVLTEDKLSTDSSTVLGVLGELIASTSKDKRDIPLRGGDIRTRDGTDTRDVVLALDVGVEELAESEVLDSHITILAGSGGVASELVGSVIETADVDLDALLIHGSEPATRPAGSDEGLDVGVTPASIGRVVSRSRGGNVHVVRDVLLVEHRARIASLHEEDHVLEHLLLLHCLEDSGNVLTIKILAVRHGDKVAVAMVIIIDKDVGLAGGMKGLSASGCRDLTGHDLDKVLSSGIETIVIVDNTLINIPVVAVRIVPVVVDLAREGVLAVVSDIILHEHNDVIVGNAIAMSNLIHVADRCLMTIVAVGGTAGDKDNPGVLTVGNRPVD